ncbi:MAG TPA: antibiotic biosynthesis monooxygenase family protein [Ktedonobacterales bacterium]
MVIEIAEFTAVPGHEEALAQGLSAAMAHFRASPACLGITLRRCLEDPAIFLYEVQWASLTAHVEGFRKSPLFASYRAHITGHFVEPVRMRHFSTME